MINQVNHLERNVLFHLHNTSGIGWKTIEKLRQTRGLVSQWVDASIEELVGIGLQQEKAKLVQNSLLLHHRTERLEQYDKLGIEWVVMDDPDYPQALRQIHQPPWVLYLKGKRSLLGTPSLAIVGTRTPTTYGKSAARKLAEGIAGFGMTIVSGLARGIDAEAHEGALHTGGSTLAVVGTPLDTVYPPEHRELFHRVVETGLAVSEVPLGTALHPGLFPLRNRIIAGLTLGTLVVEAAARSGALITAAQALDESRDVFAVPGPIYSPKSEGPNLLIKQGAKLITCAEDILEEYTHVQELFDCRHAKKTVEGLTEDEQKVLSQLNNGPLHMDDLVNGTQFEFGHLHAVLLSLLIKNHIVQLPGSAYAANT